MAPSTFGILFVGDRGLASGEARPPDPEELEEPLVRCGGGLFNKAARTSLFSSSSTSSSVMGFAIFAIVALVISCEAILEVNGHPLPQCHYNV